MTSSPECYNPLKVLLCLPVLVDFFWNWSRGVGVECSRGAVPHCKLRVSLGNPLLALALSPNILHRTQPSLHAVGAAHMLGQPKLGSH